MWNIDHSCIIYYICIGTHASTLPVVKTSPKRMSTTFSINFKSWHCFHYPGGWRFLILKLFSMWVMDKVPEVISACNMIDVNYEKKVLRKLSQLWDNVVIGICSVNIYFDICYVGFPILDICWCFLSVVLATVDQPSWPSAYLWRDIINNRIAIYNLIIYSHSVVVYPNHYRIFVVSLFVMTSRRLQFTDTF